MSRDKTLFIGWVLVGLVAVGVAAAIWFWPDDGSGAPSLPEVTGETALVVAGVAFLDDGDGLLGGGDAAIVGAEVRLGVGHQYVQEDSALTVTGADGSFVLHSPPGFDSTVEMFVELALATEGPNGGGDPSTVGVRVDVDLDTVDLLIPVTELPRRCASLTSDDCGPLLLPDLVPLLDGVPSSPALPLPAEGWRIDTDTKPGRTLLRFPSVAANLGDGPLVLMSIPPEQNVEDIGAPAEVWQRVFRADLGYVDVLVGTTFIHHEEHDHVHLDNFESYRLLDRDGAVVVSGEKVSFCLLDSLEVEGIEPLSFGVFRPTYECGAVEQSINVGWSDYYGAELYDQWIDVTGVAPGDYLVEIVVDPDNLLVERDERNNSVRFPVTLGESR